MVLKESRPVLSPLHFETTKGQANNYYEGENNSLASGESENANCEWENEFFKHENKRFLLNTSASKLMD